MMDDSRLLLKTDEFPFVTRRSCRSSKDAVPRIVTAYKCKTSDWTSLRYIRHYQSVTGDGSLTRIYRAVLSSRVSEHSNAALEYESRRSPRR